jgi:cytochrome c5
MKGMMTWFARSLCVISLLAPVTARPAAGQDDGSQGKPNNQGPPLEEGEGRELVLEKCTVCHDTARIRSTYRDEDAWAALVDNMISRGADVTPEEAKKIVAYLFEHYGIH